MKNLFFYFFLICTTTLFAEIENSNNYSCDEIGTETYTGCEGDGYSVVVNGVIYNENNPSGTEVIAGGASTGCDLIVTIDLTFNANEISYQSLTLCEGENLIYNGTVYDQGNPTGTEIIIGGASNGCNLITNIDLTYLPNEILNESYTLCEGESFTYNGIVYDEANPNGTEVIPGGGSTGCDLIVEINLVFYPNSTSYYSYALCEGESITIYDNVYTESNPNGTVVLVSSTGCDSIIIIDLTFIPNAMSTETYQGTSGDGYSVIISGVIYDENNPSGIELIAGGSYMGCDSIITIDLVFTSCSTPTAISSLVISGNVVKLSWIGTSIAERYRIRYRPVGGSWTELLTGADESFRFINELMPNTTYQYQVKSLCAASNSAWSSTASFTTLSDICDIPSTSGVTNTTSTSTVVYWSSLPDDIKYRIKYKAKNFSNPWTEVTLNPTSYTATSLMANTDYKYKLKTKCSNGWSNWSGNFNFSTPPSFSSDVAARKIKTDVQVFPNPASNFVQVRLQKEATNISIRNLDGKLLKELSPTATTEEVDIQSWTAGMYILSVLYKDGTINTQQFVKMN